MNIWQWIVETLRAYPELALFLALAIGFWIGPKKLAGFSLGNVTATLLAAVAIGQLGIQVPGPIKSTFFLLFLFAVGYGVGPQFFQGLSKDGPKQILFSLIVLALCLLAPYVCARMAGPRRRLCGRPLRRFTDDFRIDRRRDGPDQSAGASAGAGEGVPGCDPGRLRSHLHFRHDRVGHHPRPARAAAHWRRSRGRLRRIREDRWAAGRRATTPACSRRIARSRCAHTASTPESGLTGKPVRELFPGLRIFVERIHRGGADPRSGRRQHARARRRRRDFRAARRARREASRRWSRKWMTRRCSTCRSRWWTYSCAARR